MTAAIGSARVSPVDRHVGQRLRLLREILDFSLDELSALTNIDAADLRRFESGLQRIGPPTLFVLASKMQMNVAWFFEGLQAAQLDDLEAVGTDQNVAEIVNYQDGLALINRSYEVASPERREMLIAVAQSILSQQARDSSEQPGKRNGGCG